MVKNSKNLISKEILIERVSRQVDLNKTQTKEIITSFLEAINQSLIKGEEIRLVGSFTLKTAIRSARQAMNLKTKKKMMVPAKRVPKIKFSPALKVAIAEAKVKPNKK